MKKDTLKTPSVLAFESKLAPSDAILSSGQWTQRDNAAQWKPIKVSEKAVRGTISNRLKGAIANDPAKVDAEIQKANLQTVDVAALPFGCDTLKVHFTLRVLGELATPTTCNNPAYQEAFAGIIDDYNEEEGFATLANHYAANIANGRFLWRNRLGAESVTVHVHYKNEQEGGECQFDSLAYDLRDFDKGKDDWRELARVIADGLSSKRRYTLLTIEAFVQLGQGQTVFPSQELVLGGSKGDKSKFLYQLNSVAAMHSQKIGNALRTIDIWHPEVAEVGPIAVEPYGSVTNRGKAYRQPKDKVDFYHLLDRWLTKDEKPTLEQQHYIMAMLIRGGVFGKGKD